MKKFLSIVIICVAVLALFGCSKTEKAAKKTETEPKKTAEKVKDKDKEEVSEEDAELFKEENAPVETIAETSPEEAADKCLDALYEGNLTEARKYSAPDDSAFKELTELRRKMMESFEVMDNQVLKEKVNTLIAATFKQFQKTRNEIKINGNSATVTYSVSMPDMSGIDYSKYSDGYMSASGITQEQLMSQIEGMTQEESEEWSKGYMLDVMTYAFENGGDLPRVTKTTTVYLDKTENGWLVSKIENLAN